MRVKNVYNLEMFYIWKFNQMSLLTEHMLTEISKLYILINYYIVLYISHHLVI